MLNTDLKIVGSEEIAAQRRPILCSLALIATIVVLLQTYLIASGYLRHVHQEEKLTETLARVVEDQTQRSLQSVLLVLEATAREMELEHSKLDQTSVRMRLRAVPEIRGLYLLDADNKVIDSTLAQADIGINVSDHSYIKSLRKGDGAPFVIGAPILRRSPSGREMSALAYIPVAQFLTDQSKILVAAFNISFLELQYRSLLESTDASVSLSTFDGTVLVDSDRKWKPGTDISKHDPIFTKYLPATESATFDRPAILGHANEIVSFRVTRGLSVVVSVSVGWAVVWNEWTAAALPALVATAIAIALVLFASYKLMQQFRVIADQEQSLLRSRDAAEAANRAKSQFLAVMSHEIRTPMNAVLGMASTLLEEPLGADQRKSVQAIHEAGDALLGILNDILDYTRLESGQFALENLPFDPRTIVQRAANIVAPHARSKGVALEIDEMGDIPASVVGDAGRLTQVLLNLLSNAVKFTEKGKVSVALRHRSCGDGETWLEWTVADTGIGIPQDRIGSLFDEFMQADASIHRRFGGSGLGLAICKRILDQMHGSINVSSILGQGTIISVSVALPVTPKISETHRAEGSAPDLTKAIAELGRPLQLLVVDDNATNHLVAQKMLRDFPIDIDTASSGAEAIALARHKAYDVILMDMRMPEMDGPAATRTIRDEGGASSTNRIIGFTANAFPEDIAHCLEAGMNEVISKPVRKANLVAAIFKGVRDSGRAAPQALAVPEAPVAAPLFVLETLQELESEIGPEGAMELRGEFRTNALARIEELKRLDPGRDLEEIGRAAHTIKGDAGYFGFQRLSQIAAGLEKAAREGKIEGYAKTVADLEKTFEDGLAALPQVPLAA